MSEFRPEHLAVTAEALASPQPGGRFFFLPGSPARARAIAAHFTDARAFPSDRGHDVHVGRLARGGRAIDVGVVATGMGCPSVDIIVTELIALGVRSLLRVGSSGTLAEDRVPIGHLVIASGAVRDEHASRSYAPPEFPALASIEMVGAARRAAAALDLAAVVHTGLVHTKDSLFGREFGFGPLGDENRAYRGLMRRLGVLASEMETAHLFVLAQVYSASPVDAGDAPRAGAPPAIHAGCVLAAIGGESGLGDAATRDLATRRAVELALETAARFVAER